MLDEAHLLGKETLEEFRFLLNYRFDSANPMSLKLVGQTELWEQKLRLQSYAAIRQRIDMNIVLNRLDRAETGRYIAAHMAYAGVKQDLFTSGAEDEIFKVSAGIPRMINRICEKTLMYAYQQYFPARLDVLKRLWNEAEREIKDTGYTTDLSGNKQYEPRLMTKEEDQIFWHMLDCSVPSSYINAIDNIICEETALFFTDKKDVDQVANSIQNRVQNYLDEAK